MKLVLTSLVLGAALLTTPAAAQPAPTFTCVSGYVWREARSSDFVCVTPESRARAKSENSTAPQRWTAGAYGPHTCLTGFVWREAFSGDDVCVTPETRALVREENSRARERRVH